MFHLTLASRFRDYLNSFQVTNALNWVDDHHRIKLMILCLGLCLLVYGLFVADTRISSYQPAEPVSPFDTLVHEAVLEIADDI